MINKLYLFSLQVHVLRASERRFRWSSSHAVHGHRRVCFNFVVKDLSKKINARPQLRDAFDFSEISYKHLSNLGRGNARLHAGEVG